MGKKLVKLIGSGIGFTSEAIHAISNRSSGQRSGAENTSVTPDTPDTSNPRTIPDLDRGQYVIADDAIADALIREGRAELPAFFEKEHGIVEKGDDSPPADEEHDRGAHQDEAIWELDATAQQVRVPTYAELDDTPAPQVVDTTATSTAENSSDPKSEQAKQKHEEEMIRSLLQMAGPAEPKPTRQQIPCPVIIPQRRPGAKDRGFVRAYAPVLSGCGVSQDVFLTFLEDFYQASKASKWIEVINIAAEVVGIFPETAAQITSIVIQIIAGTARELQSRHRANTFLDKVNADLFMPRGLYAMVMAFKDEVPPQQQHEGALDLLSKKIGKTLFATERVDINQPSVVKEKSFDPAPTIAKYTHTDQHPEMTMMKKRLKDVRLASGSTRGVIELPEAAPLVYPDLDRAAAQGKDGTLEKLKGAGEWVQDYMDRKAQAKYETKNPGSSLAVPETGRKAFVSRYNDPNHPVNNGKLTSVLTGGLLGKKPGLIERATTSIREAQESKRVAHGQPPNEPIKEKWARYQRNKKPGLIKKVLQRDLLYLLVVNMPSEEELQQAVASLERLTQHSGQRSSC